MTYTPEQLREWAAYLAGRGSVWTLPEGMPKPSYVFRAHAAALEELADERKRHDQTAKDGMDERDERKRLEAELAKLKTHARAMRDRLRVAGYHHEADEYDRDYPKE